MKKDEAYRVPGAHNNRHRDAHSAVSISSNHTSDIQEIKMDDQLSNEVNERV
jgi:hypothetical protein